MKKFFLIPVLALFTCVSAWGADYKYVPDPEGITDVPQASAPIRKALMDEDPAANQAKIGTTEYATFQDAIEAADENAVIELLADATLGGGSWYFAIDKSITIVGNGHKITKTMIVEAPSAATLTVTFDGVTLQTSAWYSFAPIGNVTLNLANGSTNSISGSLFGAYGAEVFAVTGNGALTASRTNTFYQFSGLLRVDAPNATFSNATNFTQSTNIVINAGSYGQNPSLYVDFASHIITKPSSLYVVSAPAADVVAYNQSTMATYTSLSAAIDAASAGNEIYMYKADATAISVDKNLTIHTNGFSTNLSAASGFARADMGQNIAFTDNAIAAFLMADGTNSMTIDANADISAAGAIHVNGDKTLTINAGVEVLYKRQGSLANIVVDEGAKLTVLGSGTFTPVMHSETRTIEGFTAEISSSASNQIGNRVIDVDGELVVGAKNDAANCPHFITSSIARGSAVMVNETGVATFNNADMKVAYMSIKNYGNVTIHGGEYVSISTFQNGVDGGWFAYHLNNEGRMTVNGGHFVGVQGAFANATESAIVDINGGYFETVNGHNWATGEANSADNHYALYVATYSVVNVYGGYYKVTTPSAGGGKVALVGNNDAYNTYGIVNLYGGNFQRKVEVSPRKNKDSSYPASIPATSAWYSCFGSEAPLPAGYEYYETGDATYPYGVRAIAGKEADAIDPAQQAAQEADPEYTIPWQQATTWAADAVPEENTIVTIPVGATVTVSKDEAEKEAVADQVYVAQGATLVVEEGTTLKVGEGGVNIGNGGQLVVEEGAVVAVGTAGMITTDNEALVIEASETKQGYFLLERVAQNENTQPIATVKLYTKGYQTGANPWTYKWQRFAIPVLNITNANKPTNDYTDQALFGGATTFKSYLYGWNGNGWEQPANGWTGLEPLRGYQISNNTVSGGITYYFTGNLVGNADGNYEFQATGFDFFGNSYTAPINVEALLNTFDSQSGFEASVLVFDENENKFFPMNKATFDDYNSGMAEESDIKTQIKPMQAFIVRGGQYATLDVDYIMTIWNPIMEPTPTTAPARKASANTDVTILKITANGQKEMVALRQGEDYSSQFDNGADASKYMNEGTFNFYANTEIGEMAHVATNSLNHTILGFQSNDEAEYTLTCSGQRGEIFKLRDLVTGFEMMLNQGDTYTFAQQPNTNIDARFEIISIMKSPTSVEEVLSSKVEGGIYTILGQYVGEDFESLPAGIYVIDGVKVIK